MNSSQFSVERLEIRRLLAVTVPGFVTHTGTLVVKGTDQADDIVVRQQGKTVLVEVKLTETTSAFRIAGTTAEIKRLLVEAGDGNDTVDISGFGRRATVYGGAGNDDITGGRECTLVGGGGNDRLTATGWSAVLNASVNPVKLEQQKDLLPSALSGGLGNDTLNTLGPDSVTGGQGSDTYVGYYYRRSDQTIGQYSLELLHDQWDLDFSGIEFATIRTSTITQRGTAVETRPDAGVISFTTGPI